MADAGWPLFLFEIRRPPNTCCWSPLLLLWSTGDHFFLFNYLSSDNTKDFLTSCYRSIADAHAEFLSAILSAFLQISHQYILLLISFSYAGGVEFPFKALRLYFFLLSSSFLLYDRQVLARLSPDKTTITTSKLTNRLCDQSVPVVRHISYWSGVLWTRNIIRSCCCKGPRLILCSSTTQFYINQGGLAMICLLFTSFESTFTYKFISSILIFCI